MPTLYREKWSLQGYVFFLLLLLFFFGCLKAILVVTSKKCLVEIILTSTQNIVLEQKQENYHKFYQENVIIWRQDKIHYVTRVCYCDEDCDITFIRVSVGLVFLLHV